MPKETFFNLAEEKRARFVGAALDEFASHPYDQASVSRIVRRVGIAKGSVYQYFDDKVDLFTWLVEEGARRRVAAFADLGGAGELGFFDRLRAAYRAGLRSWAAEPRWNRVLLRLLEPTTEPRLEAMRLRQQEQVHAFLVAGLSEARARGQVRPGLDLDAAAHLAQGLLQEGLLRAFLSRLDTTLEALASGAADLEPERVEAALDAAVLAVDLVERAVGPDVRREAAR